MKKLKIVKVDPLSIASKNKLNEDTQVSDPLHPRTAKKPLPSFDFDSDQSSAQLAVCSLNRIMPIIRGFSIDALQQWFKRADKILFDAYCNLYRIPTLGQWPLVASMPDETLTDLTPDPSPEQQRKARMEMAKDNPQIQAVLILQDILDGQWLEKSLTSAVLKEIGSFLKVHSLLPLPPCGAVAYEIIEEFIEILGSQKSKHTQSIVRSIYEDSHSSKETVRDGLKFSIRSGYAEKEFGSHITSFKFAFPLSDGSKIKLEWKTSVYAELVDSETERAKGWKPEFIQLWWEPSFQFGLSKQPAIKFKFGSPLIVSDRYTPFSQLFCNYFNSVFKAEHLRIQAKTKQVGLEIELRIKAKKKFGFSSRCETLLFQSCSTYKGDPDFKHCDNESNAADLKAASHEAQKHLIWDMATPEANPIALRPDGLRVLSRPLEFYFDPNYGQIMAKHGQQCKSLAHSWEKPTTEVEFSEILGLLRDCDQPPVSVAR